MSSRKRALLLLAAAPALGGSGLVPGNWAFKTQVFFDNRDVIVSSPQVRARWVLDPDTWLTSTVEVDAVSSASPACGACHGGRATAPRIEGQLGLVRRVGSARASVGYYLSREQDYSSDAFSVTLERSFAANSTTLRARYGYSLDRVHPHGWEELGGGGGREPGEEEEASLDPSIVLAPGQTPLTDSADKRVHDAELSLTQVLTPGTLARVSVEVFQVTGDQDNPYWTIPIGNLDYLESLPEERTRRAASFRLKQSLSPAMAVEAGYRRYTDSWGIRSDTYEGKVSRYFGGGRFLVTLDHRYYDQTAANFHRDRYDAPAPILSADYRLDAFLSHLSGVKVRIEGGGDGMTWWHPGGYDIKVERFVSSEGFRSYVFEFGASSEF